LPVLGLGFTLGEGNFRRLRLGEERGAGAALRLGLGEGHFLRLGAWLRAGFWVIERNVVRVVVDGFCDTVVGDMKLVRMQRTTVSGVEWMVP